MLKKKLLITLSFVILLGSFFYVLLSCNLFDGDFWWHLSTGRYIVETGKLPDKDPFSYTSNLKENKSLIPERENFLLKQYWLAQIIFYLIFESTGPKGIIILRSLILLMTILLVLWRLHRLGVSFYISFVFIFLVYLEVIRSVGERPVLFTILFTPLTFIILEEFKDTALKGLNKNYSGRILFMLPPVMLLWSNLHGGFIIGNVIIAVYMVCEGIKIILRKSGYSTRKIVIFYIAAAVALFASYINPTGWEAFSIAFSPKYSILTSSIQEYHSPISAYISRVSPLPYGYAAMTFIFLFILILRNKRLDFTDVVLLAGFLIMATKTGRFITYYVTVAAMILGRETDILFQGMLKRVPQRKANSLEYIFSMVMLVSSILFFIGIFKYQWIRPDIAKSNVPVSAVGFMERNRFSGNMLNEAGYGGYITWRLYPWKRTFIDTRWLSATTQAEYAWMMNAVETIANKELPEGKVPLWKRLLDHYGINFVLFDTLDVYGTVPNLLLKLTEDDGWAPVYCDPIAVIFVRNIPENHEIIEKYKFSKDYVFDAIILVASYKATNYRGNPRYLITLGKTFYEMGRLEDSLKAYRYAAQRRHDTAVQEKINQIESEIKNKKEKKEI